MTQSPNKAQKLLAERNGQEVSDDLPLVLQSRGLEIPDVFQINDSGCKQLELPNGKVECFKDKKQVFGEEKFAKAGFKTLFAFSLADRIFIYMLFTVSAI